MISLCLITKNEEEWIGDFLDHLKPAVSEIIVCDTGSIDQTKTLASVRGAKVFDIAWEDHFAKARNQSIALATQPWILILDPDIRIAKNDVLKLLALTQNTSTLSFEFVMRNYVRNPNLRDFQLCRGEYPHEEKGMLGFFEDTRVALFKNHCGIQFEGVVHETVLNSVKENMQASDIVLHHYGLLPEQIEIKQKRALYHKLSKRKVEMNPTDWRAQLELGMEYMSSNEFENATEAFAKANTLKPNDVFILNRLLNAQSRAMKTKEAVLTAQQLIQLEPQNHDALLAISAGHILNAEYEQAARALQTLLTHHPESEKGRMNLAILYSQLKRPAEAFQLLKTMIERNWNDAGALKLTFEMALYSDQFTDAEKCIRRYLELVPQDLYARGHLTTALMYQGRLNESLKESYEVLHGDPQHYLAHFNAGVIHFERANWPAATQHLQSALKAKPNDQFILKALEQIQRETTVPS